MLPQACLPATGADQTHIVLLATLAVLLLAAGAIAMAKTRGRIALVLIPVAILALVVGAPGAPARALETAIPNYSFSDTWTVSGDVVAWDATSEDATGQALVDSQTLYDMEVDGSATKTVSLVVSNGPNPANTYTFQIPPWLYDDFDFSTLIPGTGPNSISTAMTLLQDTTNLDMVLTFTYDYKDSCNRPLQTVLTYTGTVTAPQPVP